METLGERVLEFLELDIVLKIHDQIKEPHSTLLVGLGMI